jgi:hypothetical protein
MKITRSNLKGVGLLLLSLAAVGEGRNFAADIASQNFLAMADGPSASAAGSATASPFKDESASTPAKSVTGETTTATALPPTDMAPAYDCFLGAPGKVWFRGEYVHWFKRSRTTELPRRPFSGTRRSMTATTTVTV